MFARAKYLEDDGAFEDSFVALRKANQIKYIGFNQAPIDWKNKEVRFLDPVYTTEDTEGDIKKIEDLFRGVIGKVAEDSF